MVDKAVSPLMIEIKKLRDEVQILKSSIFEMAKMSTRETPYSSLKLPCWDDRLSEKSSVLSSNEIEGNVFAISGNSDKKGPLKNLDKTSFKRNVNLRSAGVEDNQNVYEPNKNAPVKSNITNGTSKTRVMKTLIMVLLKSPMKMEMLLKIVVMSLLLSLGDEKGTFMSQE
ncbi:hypothetical protein Zmor_026854 [Zophobas morio]|uniref:Uncharacterized protein n=1 Tax=Zophobas morio TaxID=2755281 RepID=A0AA38M5W9_9CUCU|nr:hypothetical protein Zmor_026854 [Zophobas morio]